VTSYIIIIVMGGKVQSQDWDCTGRELRNFRGKEGRAGFKPTIFNARTH
jgi:hypothetical protein